MNIGMTREICSLTLKVVFISEPSEDEDKVAGIPCRKEHFIYNSVLKCNLEDVRCGLTVVMRQMWGKNG